MNYEDMSDFEINKLVATHESLIINDFQPMAKRATGSEVRVNDIVNCWGFNPCGDSRDSWGIICENHISICFGSRLATAKAFTDSELIQVIDKNPLRAAMICFLKMKDAENEK